MADDQNNNNDMMDDEQPLNPDDQMSKDDTPVFDYP